jgi:hypothetical protein
MVYKNIRVVLLTFLLVGFILLPLSDVIALECTSTEHDPGPCCPGPAFQCSGCPECLPAPINDGLMLLLLAGGLFGVKKAVFSK